MPHTPEQTRALRQSRIDRGICPTCGIRESLRGLTRCGPCHEKHVRANSVRRAKLSSAGSCRRCGKQPAEAGRESCGACLEQQRKVVAARDKAVASAGLCVACRSPRGDSGSVRWCAGCCASTTKRNAVRRARLVADGTCTRCACKPADAGQRCRICFFRMTAGRLLKDPNRGSELDALWEKQRGLCALTGRPLILCADSQSGRNPRARRLASGSSWSATSASLDHIVPRSRGGSDDIGNLRWVADIVNRMKLDQLDDELLSMCRELLTASEARST